jgi:hypothetical protein
MSPFLPIMAFWDTMSCGNWLPTFKEERIASIFRVKQGVGIIID